MVFSWYAQSTLRRFLVDRLTPHKCTLAFIIVLQEHCSVSCRRVLADAGCQHGGRVPLPARRREAGDLGEGGTVVLEAPGQVRERLPGAVSPSPPAAPLLGGGVAGTLGGRGRGSDGDPAEGRLTPLWLWLHSPVVEPGLLRGPLHGPARRQVGKHTGAPRLAPTGSGCTWTVRAAPCPSTASPPQAPSDTFIPSTALSQGPCIPALGWRRTTAL